MLYLFVFLKLPILALGCIVWWAVHQTPEPEDEPVGGACPACRGAARTAIRCRCRPRACAA